MEMTQPKVSSKKEWLASSRDFYGFLHSMDLVLAAGAGQFYSVMGLMTQPGSNQEKELLQ